jgi:O-acetyl-ADP-ribose deacetylase
LELAVNYGLTSIAFPAISTYYGSYPPAAAGEVAIHVVKDFIQQHEQLTLVRFVIWSESVYRAFITGI